MIRIIEIKVSYKFSYPLGKSATSLSEDNLDNYVLVVSNQRNATGDIFLYAYNKNAELHGLYTLSPSMILTEEYPCMCTLSRKVFDMRILLCKDCRYIYIPSKGLSRVDMTKVTVLELKHSLLFTTAVYKNNELVSVIVHTYHIGTDKVDFDLYTPNEFYEKYGYLSASLSDAIISEVDFKKLLCDSKGVTGSNLEFGGVINV